jgi:hypothetical protein
MVEETGLTFGQWPRQLHLIIALRELASGATVQRVSGDLGYESPHSVYRNVQQGTRHNTGALFRILIGFDGAAFWPTPVGQTLDHQMSGLEVRRRHCERAPQIPLIECHFSTR